MYLIGKNKWNIQKKTEMEYSGKINRTFLGN
jgi:hypothetical protein